MPRQSCDLMESVRFALLPSRERRRAPEPPVLAASLLSVQLWSTTASVSARCETPWSAAFRSETRQIHGYPIQPNRTEPIGFQSAETGGR
eukprot:scaffold529_cov308-Pinguiococcus_pyrenoidosus.AAC.28